MKTVKLLDSTFAWSNALGLSSENDGEHPESFQWYRDGIDDNLAVFTDLRLREAVGHPAKKKIGLIVESPAVAQESHRTALDLREHFDVILTHNKELIDTGEPFKFYPLGGSRIKRWGFFPKFEKTSIIVGAKQNTEGQRLRHRIAKKYAKELDLWGEPYTEYMPTKTSALRPYMYSIVIENGKEDYYFSEKLIDCLSQGTVPIYWGCPSVHKFFKPEGIIRFHRIDELKAILDGLSLEDYQTRLTAIFYNLAAALHYRCAEDWIFEKYPGIFE